MYKNLLWGQAYASGVSPGSCLSSPMVPIQLQMEILRYQNHMLQPTAADVILTLKTPYPLLFCFFQW